MDVTAIAKSVLGTVDREIAAARGIPPEWYTDPGIFAAEQELIFRKTWFAVCFSHEVAETGDVLPLQVCGTRAVILRDEAGNVRAFQNVCRHRASLVVQEPAKGRRSLRCSYHCWTYGLNGKLKNAPFFNGKAAWKDGDGEKIGLFPIRCEEREGAVFVNLDGSAPSIDDFMKPLETRWKSFDRSRLHRFATVENTIPANWKVVMEGLLEVYHEEFIHEDLGYRLTKDGMKAWEDLWTGELMGFRSVMPVEDVDASKPSLPRLPGMPQTGPAPTEIFLMFPNLSCNILDTHLVYTIWNLAAAKETGWKSTWYFAPGAADSQSGKALCNDVVDFWKKVRREDMGAILAVQSGLESRACEPIETRYSPFWEPILQHFHLKIVKGFLAEKTGD